MTKEEAIQILSTRDWSGMLCGYTSGYTEALDMAIEALQFVKHFDLLKEYQSLQEVVQCKDCKHRETDDCPMYWEEWLVIEDCDGYADDKYVVHDYTTNNGYCSYGERK